MQKKTVRFSCCVPLPKSNKKKFSFGAYTIHYSNDEISYLVYLD